MEYTNTNSSEYASKGVGNTALGLSIGALGVELLGAGAMGIFGNKSASNNYYTKDLAEKDAKISELTSQQIVDTKLVEVYKELRAQDKAQDEKIANLNTRVTSIEVASPLREQIVLGQVNNVANSVTAVNNDLSNRIGGMNATIQGQIFQINQTLNNITKEVVPTTAICPQPMPLYNSWTAPTSAT